MAPPATRTRKRDWQAISREELPRLLREGPGVRGQVFASLNEHLTKREETAALLAELREMRRAFAAKMEEQGRRFDEHSRPIERLTAAVEHHSRTLAEHGARLERLTAAVDEHSQILAEHGERLERPTVAMEKLVHRVEVQGQLLEARGREIEALAAHAWWYRCALGPVSRGDVLRGRQDFIYGAAWGARGALAGP